MGEFSDVIPEPFLKIVRPVVKIYQKSIDRLRINYYRSKVDVYVVSYRKSGRTWLRYLLGKIIEKKYNIPVEMKSFRYSDLSSEFINLNENNIPRIIFCHDEDNKDASVNDLRFNKKVYKDKKIVFLVREPKDVLTSHYLHKKNRNLTYDKIISEFIRDPKYGIDKLIKFMNLWENNRDLAGKFLLMKYEDMKEDTKSEVKKFLDFIGLNVEEEIIDWAIEESRFEKMKEIEIKNTLENVSSPELRAGNLDNEDSFKVRKGKVGGYSEYMSKEDVEFINQRVNNSLSSYFDY